MNHFCVRCQIEEDDRRRHAHLLRCRPSRRELNNQKIKELAVQVGVVMEGEGAEEEFKEVLK